MNDDLKPEDYSEAFSSMAGMVWIMYRRFIGEGASTMEAAILSSQYICAMVTMQKPDDDAA